MKKFTMVDGKMVEVQESDLTPGQAYYEWDEFTESYVICLFGPSAYSEKNAIVLLSSSK